MTSNLLYTAHSRHPILQSLLSQFALNSSEIVSRVQIGEFPPFRPTVSELITGVEEIRELMKQCWEENPDLRPDFHEIKKIVNKILTNNGMWVSFTNQYQILAPKSDCIAYQPLNRTSVSNWILLPNICYRD